jgi:hypothetical protein
MACSSPTGVLSPISTIWSWRENYLIPTRFISQCLFACLGGAEALLDLVLYSTVPSFKLQRFGFFHDLYPRTSLQLLTSLANVRAPQAHSLSDQTRGILLLLTCITFFSTERVGIAETPLTHTQEVLGSNLGREQAILKVSS